MYLGLPNLGLSSRKTSSGASLDTDVAAWLVRVASAGGTVSSPTTTAVNTFVLAAKAASIWTMIRRLNLCCGDFLASFVPLKNEGSVIDVNTNLISSDYSESLGWQTDGSTKYLRTGFFPDQLTLGLSVYFRGPTISSGSPLVMGCNTGANYFDLGYDNPITRGTVGGVVQPFVTASMTAALWHTSRTSATASAIYKNGVSQGTSAVSVSFTAPGEEIYIFARNQGGGPANYIPSGSRVAGYGIGYGMDSTQAAAYYTAMQAFQTSMGRQV